jgi:hypothetical protein
MQLQQSGDSDNGQQQGEIGAQRRVALAAESEEGLRSLMDWTSSHIARHDDVEFKLLVCCRCTVSVRLE